MLREAERAAETPLGVWGGESDLCIRVTSATFNGGADWGPEEGAVWKKFRELVRVCPREGLGHFLE